jgi:hypothetical protein
MSTSRIYGNFDFPGEVALTGTVNLPAGAVTNASVLAAANIAGTKTNHRHHIQYHQVGTVAAETELVFCAYAACTVLSVKAAVVTVATGADRELTVEVKKSTGGGALSTILSSALAIDETKAALTHYDATLSGTPTMVADDLLAVVIAVSGSAGAQAVGLLVTIVVEENGT